MSFSPSDLAKRSTVDEFDETAVTDRITASLEPLRTLGDLATPEHVEVFEAVQKALADALSTVDDA
ncbi:hypothetical protein [Stackebrandtia soli]|uniref:hypothetical protein n=1 Tax=Stackebrandtia soli TaxID=1892856 RepID=UPI0039E9AC2D